MDANLVTIASHAATTEQALVELHAAGASPVRAIRALCTGRGLDMREAKAALHTSPAWIREARAAEHLHDQIIQFLEDEPEPRD